MVVPDLVARKIATASARLDDVREFLDRDRDAFLADLRGRDVTAFYLQLAIQDCIDLASHWLSEAGWPPPDDAGSAFDVLADHGVLTRELATVMRDAVGLRNRIAHGYATLDHSRLYDEAHAGCPLLEEFLVTIAREAGL